MGLAAGGQSSEKCSWPADGLLDDVSGTSLVRWKCYLPLDFILPKNQPLSVWVGSWQGLAGFGVCAGGSAGFWEAAASSGAHQWSSGVPGSVWLGWQHLSSVSGMGVPSCCSLAGLGPGCVAAECRWAVRCHGAGCHVCGHTAWAELCRADVGLVGFPRCSCNVNKQGNFWQC